MTHPAPTGDHVPGHTTGAHSGGAEPFASFQRNEQSSQWSGATNYTYNDPPQYQQYQPQYQPYQPSGAAPYPGYPQQPVPGMNPTNPFAIASLIVSLVGTGLIGVILGHIALAQIKRSNGYEQGRGLAIAGLVIGYAKLALAVIGVIIFFGLIFIIPTTVPPGAVPTN